MRWQLAEPGVHRQRHRAIACNTPGRGAREFGFAGSSTACSFLVQGRLQAASRFDHLQGQVVSLFASRAPAPGWLLTRSLIDGSLMAS